MCMPGAEAEEESGRRTYLRERSCLWMLVLGFELGGWRERERERKFDVPRTRHSP